jgi:hypothetical protein
MTGHEKGSHKKKKKTRLEDTDEKRAAKRLCSIRSPAAVTTPPVVSQTQDSSTSTTIEEGPFIVDAASPTNADNAAIANMAAGATDDSTPNDAGGNNIDFALRRLQLFKDRTSKQQAVKLTGASVFAFLRKPLVPGLIEDLETSQRLRSSSSASVKRAVNGFDTAVYTYQIKVPTGKSRRLAANLQKSATITPDSKHEVDIPSFDIKKATKIMPEVNWAELNPTYNLDSKRMRRYIVEDVMFADPDKHERLLLLVSSKHTSFLTTWLPIYKAQSSSRIPITFDKINYYQIEAEVIKNSKREDYMNGMVSEDDVKYQLTFEGGAGVCLQFPFCHQRFDIEMKFATVFYEPETFQVWGMQKLGREFHKRLVKLKNESNREALYCRYLTELYGDTAQTMYLSANYKVFEGDTLAATKLLATTVGPTTEDYSEVYGSLTADGDVFKYFVQHVEGVFEKAVVDCYGRFVSLTEPIVSQPSMVHLVDLFKEKFQAQYWAIAMLLKYNVNMKLFRCTHLLPFYDRMIFYHFLSMCRVRCHRTFTWWALVNACMRYGSSVNTASSGLDSVFFGHSLVPFSVMRKTKAYREIDEAYFNRIADSLKDNPILLAVFDNTQIGIQLKYQRDGKSSSFLKMTAKMFVKMRYNWNAGHDLKDVRLSFIVPITFLDQVIVSPYGMPRYETLLEKPPGFAILNYNDECYEPFHGSDATGKRVSTYVDHVFLAEELKAQMRYLSRPETLFQFVTARTTGALKTTGIGAILMKNRARNGLYERAGKFQRESVKKWKGDQRTAELLCLPLSIDDETRTEECGNVMLSLLERSGIIEVRNKDVNTIKLAADHQSKWQITIGDGLSQMRMRQYNESVDKASVNFRQYFRQSLVFSQAMNQVLMIPGDLHGGGSTF